MPEPAVSRDTQARVWVYNIPPAFGRVFLLKLGTTFDGTTASIYIVLTIHNQLN
jgi:hypothetical protein